MLSIFLDLSTVRKSYSLILNTPYGKSKLTFIR